MFGGCILGVFPLTWAWNKCLIYGKYLHFRFLEWPLMYLTMLMKHVIKCIIGKTLMILCYVFWWNADAMYFRGTILQTNKVDYSTPANIDNIYTYIYISMHIHTCTYIYIYTHIHTLFLSRTQVLCVQSRRRSIMERLSNIDHGLHKPQLGSHINGWGVQTLLWSIAQRFFPQASTFGPHPGDDGTKKPLLITKLGDCSQANWLKILETIVLSRRQLSIACRFLRPEERANLLLHQAGNCGRPTK